MNKKILVIGEKNQQTEELTYSEIKERYGLDPMEVDSFIENGGRFFVSDDKQYICFDVAF